MGLKILLISSIVGVLGMITLTQAVPIEVVYTGDSCDCPAKLNYLVNMPLPPAPKPYPTSEYGYKVDVPVPAKAKVTYSFDFAVQQPYKPPPVAPPALNLYAKIDRITAPKKDCLPSYAKPPVGPCGYSPCKCAQNNANRYVTPEYRATRNVENQQYSNSISKDMPIRTTSKILAIFMQPLEDETKSTSAKSRNKRDITKIFSRPRKTNSGKRPERLVKQYTTRLSSRSENLADFEETQSEEFFDETPKVEEKIVEETPKISQQIVKETPREAPREAPPRETPMRNILKTWPEPPTIPPLNRIHLENLRNLFMLPRLRNKRDIKGEYDLLEKERRQLDLTLPEIIQFMPETLDPNFKRGQCEFGHRCQLQQQLQHQQEQISGDESTTTNTADESTTESESLDNVDKESTDDNDSKQESENAISTTHTKRNAANYGCGLTFDPYNPQSANPTPTPGYTFESLSPRSSAKPNYDALPRPYPESYSPRPPPPPANTRPYSEPYSPPPAPPSYNPNYDALPRPFSVAANPFGADPAPQQYVGATYGSVPPSNNSPIVGSSYNPRNGPYIPNPQLDQIITDIVNRHSGFIEASTHQGGALVDPSKEQEYQTKSFLKNLMAGHIHKWFSDEPLDNSYSYSPPNYRVAGAPPTPTAFAPPRQRY